MPNISAFQISLPLHLNRLPAPNTSRLRAPPCLSATTPPSAQPNLPHDSNHFIPPSSTPPLSPPLSPSAPLDYKLAPDEVGVRFINTPSGADVIAAALPGDPLLRVGDSVSLSIPRGCQSGLCGVCTVDIINPVTSEVETVRACQTGVYVAGDATEMLVDVERMKEVKGGRRKDPMARFENLDTDYVAGAAPRVPGWTEMVTCTNCEGTGDVECLACDGMGMVDGDECLLCAGTGLVRCAECQGTGSRMIRR